jgi:hypothetical protein
MLVNSQAITDDLIRLIGRVRASRVLRQAEAQNRDRAGACDTNPASTPETPPSQRRLTDAEES